MRQAGFKPKSHDSGVYWVRANASSKGGEGKPTSFSTTLYWIILALCILVGMIFNQEYAMPKYRIYIPVKAEDVYEVEAESVEEARKYVDEYGLDYQHFIHTTDTHDMDENAVYTPKIDIEECD